MYPSSTFLLSPNYSSPVITLSLSSHGATPFLMATPHLLLPLIILPLKKGIMFFTSPLGLSVCHHVCGEMMMMMMMMIMTVEA